MTERKLLVENKNGIHARPSAAIVSCVSKYNCDVRFKTSEGEADAKSIMAILMLRILCGTEISVIVNGANEVDALDDLENLFKEKFGFEE